MKKKFGTLKRCLAFALSFCIILGGLSLNCLSAFASEGTNVFVRIEDDTVYFQMAVNKMGTEIAEGTEVKNELSKGMSFNKDSVKLLMGNVTEDGIVPTTEDLGIGIGYTIDYSIKTDGSEVMTIRFLKETSAVAVLDYSVKLTDKKNITSYKNMLVEPGDEGDSTTTISFTTKTYIENVTDYDIVPEGTEGAEKISEYEGKAVVKVTGTKVIVDKEAWDEEIEIPAETHEETQTVTDQWAWTEEIQHPAETHEETITVTDKEAWTETIHHPAETEMVEKEVTVKEAWDEVIEHPAETHEETKTVVDKEAWTEQVPHAAVTHQEEVTVIDRVAYEEKIAAKSDHKENLTKKQAEAEIERYIKELGYAKEETHMELTETKEVSTDWVFGVTKDELAAAKAKLIAEGYSLGLTEDDIIERVDTWSKITYGGSLDGNSRGEHGDCSYGYIALSNCTLTCHNRGAVLCGGTVTSNNDIDGGVQTMTEEEKETFLAYWTAIGQSKAILIDKNQASRLYWNMNESAHVQYGDGPVNYDPNMPVYYYDGSDTIEWNGVWGVLIAPKANVVVQNCDATGTVIASSVTSGAEYHLWAWSKDEQKGESYALIGQKTVELYKVWAQADAKTIHHPEESHTETKTIVDKEAWTEEIKHEAETHNETNTVVDKEAWTEIIKHPAETKTVQEEVIVKDAWDEEIKHEAETHDETITIVDKEPWTEYVDHDPITHEEIITVIDVEAHKEIIHHDAEKHSEPTVNEASKEFSNVIWGVKKNVPTPQTQEDPDDPTDPSDPTDPGDPTDPQNPGDDEGEVLGEVFENPDEQGEVLGEQFIKTGDNVKVTVVLGVLLMVFGGILGVISIACMKSQKRVR